MTFFTSALPTELLVINKEGIEPPAPGSNFYVAEVILKISQNGIGILKGCLVCVAVAILINWVRMILVRFAF